MERDEKSDFPTGSSGGGGKRGYGVRTFLHPRGEDSPPNEAAQIDDNRNDQNMSPVNEQNDADWIDDGVLANGNEETPVSRASSVSEDLDSVEEIINLVRDRFDDLNEGPRGGVTIYSYSFINARNANRAFGVAGCSGGPFIASVSLRLNGSNPQIIRCEVPNGGNAVIPVVDLGNNNALVPRQGNAGLEGMDNGRNGGIGGNNIGNIFYYTTTTAFAHRRRNGDVLSEMLSLRDAHIFNIMDVTDYVGSINQICNNLDLADAMINHIHCLKALLTRNLPLALAKQIACLNAVMRLLKDAYESHEEWAVAVVHTVNFDLRVIFHKASNNGGQVIEMDVDDE